MEWIELLAGIVNLILAWGIGLMAVRRWMINNTVIGLIDVDGGIIF